MKAIAAFSLLVLSVFLAACGNGVTGDSVAQLNSCYDSDGGKNLESFGIVKVSAPGGNSYEIKDQCIGIIYLIEGYCDGDQGKTENFVCEDFCDPFDHVCF